MDLTIKDYTIVNVIRKIRNSEEMQSYTLIDIQNILNFPTKYGKYNFFLKDVLCKCKV